MLQPVARRDGIGVLQGEIVPRVVGGAHVGNRFGVHALRGPLVAEGVGQFVRPSVLLSQAQGGRGVDHRVVRARAFHLASHLVLRRKERLRVGPRVLVLVGALHVAVQAEAPGVVGFEVVVEARHLCGPRVLVGGGNVAHVHHLALLPEVVDIAVDHQALPVVEAHEHALCAVELRRGGIGFQFGQPYADILPLQLDVHDVALVVHVASGEFGQFAGPVIDLQMFDHISRQVVERSLYVTVEKVFAADKQVLHGLAVDAYHAVLQFHSGQLFHQFSQRFRLRHVEGVGVIDQGVALVHKLQFRRRHRGFTQVALLGLRCEVDAAQVHTLAALLPVCLHRLLVRFVPLGLHHNAEPWPRGHPDSKYRIILFVRVCPTSEVRLFSNHLEQGHARSDKLAVVGIVDGHCGLVQPLLGYGVAHTAAYFYLLRADCQRRGEEGCEENKEESCHSVADEKVQK